MSPKEKFIEFDMKPVCKKCFDRFPYELKKRLKKSNDFYQKDRQEQAKNEKKKLYLNKNLKVHYFLLKASIFIRIFRKFFSKIEFNTSRFLQ
jgi:hypothetical protein